MKLISLCFYCLVSIAYALIPNQASALELSLECDYLGPVIGTAQPRIVYLLCTSFNGLHRIFMTADAYTQEFVDSGGRYVYYYEHARNGEAEGSIVAFPCGSRPVGTGP